MASDWTQGNGTWTSVQKGNSVEIAAAGGRVVSVKLQGREVLEQHARQTGSTFWTAPQSDWSWPPLDEHDTLEYAIKKAPGIQCSEDHALILEGKADPKLGLAISKSFRWVDAQVMEQIFTIHNAGTSPQKAAPWQITRVPPGGLSFFKAGDAAQTRGNLELREDGGFCFLQHQGEDQKKVFAHAAEGWLAHAGRDTVLVKVFPPIDPADFAPGEAQIELYAAFDYVEVEAQGAYRSIQAESAESWKVLWGLYPREAFDRDPLGMALQVQVLARELAARFMNP